MTVKEYLKEHLEGKYINGFKINDIEEDPFIRGQLNLFTNETRDIGFGDKEVIKFYLSDKPAGAKIYREKSNKNILRVIDLLIMHSEGYKMPKVVKLLNYNNLLSTMITYNWDNDLDWYINLQGTATLDVYRGINDEVIILDE